MTVTLLIIVAVLVLVVLVLAAYIIFLRADLVALNIRIENMAGELERVNASLSATSQKLDDANARVAALVAAQADSVPASTLTTIADGIDALGAKADAIAKAP